MTMWINGTQYVQAGVIVMAAGSVLYKGANRFLHDYGDPTADGGSGLVPGDALNVFLGLNAGNFTLGPGGGATHLGTQNTAVGVEAMYAATTAWANVAVGGSALTAITTGYVNTAVGFGSGKKVTTGFSNTLIGDESGCALTTGNYNTVLGAHALETAVSALNNVAVGTSAMPLGTGDSNTVVGHQAGLIQTTGASNVLLGYKAGDNLTSGGSNILIGAQVQAPSATGSNQISIGGVYLGNSSTLAASVPKGFTAVDLITGGAFTGLYAGGKGALGVSRFFAQMETATASRFYACGPDGSTYGSFEFYPSTSTTPGTPLQISNNVFNFAGAATFGAFGCNSAAAQTAYASGGALSAYGTGAFGFDSDAHASEVHALLVKVRAALVACGIMS